MKIKLSEISRVWPIAKRRTASAIASWAQRLLAGERLVRDVFGKGRSKRVLMCHLPEAFNSKPLSKYHSNLTECYTIARCFDRLGYSVDCCSRGKTGIDYSPYDVVFGINGNAFMGSFDVSGKQPLRIFYSVGAEMCYNYKVTALRNREFFERHGLWLLNSNRYMPGDGRAYYETTFSDAVVMLGSEYVLEQYLKQDDRKEKYALLPAFYFKVTEPEREKDFAKCNKSILWFGSSGMVHKGLDIVIDFVMAHKEYTLHVCGGSRLESGFWDYYNPKVKECGNIIMHGFVDIESKEFARILSECGILASPSISEGMAVAVLNVIGNGALLPVYSVATGIDFGRHGIMVADVTYAAFEEALSQAGSMPVEELALKAWAAHKLIRENYTIEQYEQRMFSHLKTILENKDKI